MTIDRIIALYGKESEIAYAGALAMTLDVELTVLTMSQSQASQAAAKIGLLRKTDYPILVDVRRILDRSGYHPKQVQILGYDGSLKHAVSLLQPNDLIVSNAHIADVRSHAILAPQNETSLFRQGKPGILLPLGDNELATLTYRRGLFLSRRLLPHFGQVTLYHTTWKKPDVSEDQPTDHISQKALDIIQAAEKAGEDLDIVIKTTVRTDETVVRGIAEAALRTDASLIIVVRDPEVVLGDYAEQLAELLVGSVPLLILPFHHLE